MRPRAIEVEKMKKTRKIAIGALSVTMAACMAASQLVAFADKSNGFSAGGASVGEVAFNKLTGSIDLSDITRSQLSKKVTDYGAQAEEAYFNGTYSTKTVIVSLDTPSLSESIGDDETVAEYIGTPKGMNALKAINDSQNEFLKNLSASAISYKVKYRYSTVTNAVAIEVNTSKFNQIMKMKGVASAGISLTYSALEINAQENPSNVFKTGIYDSSKIIEDYGFDGSGVTVAILDTGLDYTHEAFAKEPETLGFDRDYVKGKVEAKNSSGQPLLVAAQRSKITVDDVYINDKVPFAYDYSDSDADVYPSYSQHGTHVAGIVAGKTDSSFEFDGVNYENFSGAAPNAQLVICKVFTDDLNSIDLGGARSEDIVAALDDCYNLGVDIINMSLGTTSGFSMMEDEDIDGNGYDLNRVYRNIQERGISLIAAAGNEYSSGFGSEFGTNLASNPDSGTVGSPSTYAGAMSVASINGQQAPYMLANGTTPIYYYESNDANAVPNNFADELLGSATKETFTYLVIPGTGSKGDYSASVKSRLKNRTNNEKILVVVRRGTLSFQEKVEIAGDMGADGIIVYNNVSGTIRMSLGDIDKDKYIPAVSINMDAGRALTIDPNNPKQLMSEGKIEIDKNNLAGPFMNDYSSWGATPDLKLKPDITSHGGDIISTVAGGYEKMSGTSMATPNLAGLMALVKNYLKVEHNLSGAALTTRTNQIVMSSATLLFDEQHLPYSPRKQGAGLATLSNIFTTKAYLWTETSEDNRPKIELGEDEGKKGVYSFTFHVTNFGDANLDFKLVSRFFTETLSPDGLAVAQSAYMLDDIAAQFKVDGKSSDGNISVAAGGTAKIEVTLKLSDAEKKYLNDSFKNGMYVEGFISLESKTGGQCNMNLPFMGFYGDWEAAPMLDYDAYQIAEIEADKSLNDNEKPHESVYATQLYSTYFNGRYALPMGGYAYLQNENAEQVYTNEEYCAISRFNIYNGATATSNYMTSTGIRALYAGLLRNAELITYDIYNVDTGEIVYQGKDYSVGKAYANGGSARPALVDMKLDTEALGLINNGKYEIEFNFYMKTEDEATMKGKNTFSSNFYVDYDAPILQNSRIRYYDYKEGNKIKQRIYLDLDIFDNHYPQAILLCYSEGETTADGSPKINLATEYVTPIYKPVRNSTNTVTIEITDIYEKYGDSLYVQVDDYALNHNVYQIFVDSANEANQGNDFRIVTNDRVSATQSLGRVTYNLTLEKNELYKVELDCGNGNASNYQWTTTSKNVKIKSNGEIFGVSATTGSERAEVKISGTVKDANGNSDTKTLILYVTVADSERTLSRPTISFGLIQGTSLNLQVGAGTVKVNAGQTFTLEIKTDPWYYPVEELELHWESDNEDIATVDQNGVVVTKNKRGTAVISAYIVENGKPTNYSATVTLSVAEPFDISNMILNHYYGSDEVVYIPNDENVMYIGEEAFEDNDTMKAVIIPQTVTEISERAFLNCTALEEIYFIKMDENSKYFKQPPEDFGPIKNLSAALNLILADAFSGCKNLKILDLTYVKVITVADRAFMDTPLEEIHSMDKIGIAGDYAFAGTQLKEIDISGLHTSGKAVFSECALLESVKTGRYTAMGEGMFYKCTSLKSIVINNSNIPGGAFESCESLESVTFGGNVLSIGSYAFANTAITEFTMPKGVTVGDGLFAKIKRDKDGKIIEELPNNGITIHWEGCEEDSGAIYSGTTLIKAPSVIDSTFAIKAGTTVIGAYAFADITLNGVETVVIPESVKELGEGAFARAAIKSITIPSKVSVIPAFAFMSSALESITIPSTVTTIEEGAFAVCEKLAEVTFADGSSLGYIGDGAFSSTAIINITLPDGVTTMGDMVFFDCAELVSVTLPSVKSLGGYIFEECPKLEKATFGANATSSGYYTFFPGLKGYREDENGNLVPVFMESSLKEVDLGGLEELDDGVFSACVSLENIDLKNVTKIGSEAFASCSALASVTNLDKVTNFGLAAFADTALTALNLAAAEIIGAQAFINVEATSLSIPKVEKIGAQAFAGILINELNIPATLKVFGDGAFMAATKLINVKVDSANATFFAESNVLYRNVVNARTGAKSYELCLYPAARQANNNKFTVKEGTSAIQAYSFAYLNQTGAALKELTLPYSVKTIGASAFGYSFSIATYNFESIEAPRLLSEYYNTGLDDDGFHSLYYTNFHYPVLSFMTGIITGAEKSTLTIGYPSNGRGYNNFIFGNYFGSTVDLGELMDDNTRALIALIDGYFGLEGVSSWNNLLEKVSSWINLEVSNENKAMVAGLSDKVKLAHGMYNDLASAKQREFFSSDRAKKITEIEEALKPLKARFEVPVKISTVSVSSTSNHRSVYAVGEIFDLKGLVIEVAYDDFTSELISDTSKVILRTTGELHSYDMFVSLEYQGFTFRVSVTVSEDAVPPDSGEKDKKGGCGACGTIDLGTTAGGTGIALLTAIGIIFISHKIRRKKNDKEDKTN